MKALQYLKNFWFRCSVTLFGFDANLISIDRFTTMYGTRRDTFSFTGYDGETFTHTIEYLENHPHNVFTVSYLVRMAVKNLKDRIETRYRLL